MLRPELQRRTGPELLMLECDECAWQMEAAAAEADSWHRARDVQAAQRHPGDTNTNDASWNLTFGVNNHLVLLTATALFIVYIIASLMLFVWRWRGCLVRKLH